MKTYTVKYSKEDIEYLLKKDYCNSILGTDNEINGLKVEFEFGEENRPGDYYCRESTIPVLRNVKVTYEEKSNEQHRHKT